MIHFALVLGYLKVKKYTRAKRVHTLSLYFSNKSALISQLCGTNLTACRLNHLLSALHQTTEYRSFIWWMKCRGLQPAVHAG